MYVHQRAARQGHVKVIVVDLHRGTKPGGANRAIRKEKTKRNKPKEGSGKSDRTRSVEKSEGGRRWNGGPDIQGRIRAKKWVESSQAG